MPDNPESGKVVTSSSAGKHLRKAPFHLKGPSILARLQRTMFKRRDDQLAYPQIPPPPPNEIIAMGYDYYEKYLKPRLFKVPKGEYNDTPLYALYRLYESILTDNTIWMRNEIEDFFNHGEPEWAISRIPDPKDTDPTRYAVVSCIPELLKLAFDEKTRICGPVRGYPSILTEEQMEELRALRETNTAWEELPEWCEKVLALDVPLKIPYNGGKVVESSDAPGIFPPFKKKNILLLTPHIYFV